MPRLVTSITGHIAEHFVCYDLARRGFRVLNNPFEQSPYDILAEKDGVIYKIQVKGTKEVSKRIRKDGSHQTTHSYRFNYRNIKNKECDLIAFVAVDLEKIVYEIPCNLEHIVNGFTVNKKKMCVGCDTELLVLTNRPANTTNGLSPQ